MPTEQSTSPQPAPADAAMIRIRGLAKSYGVERVLEALDMELEAGHCLAVLGPSGSGKTTLLRLLAGEEEPDAGRMEVGGMDLAGLSPERRGVVMLGQEALLFPHLDVFENLAFGLRMQADNRGPWAVLKRWAGQYWRQTRQRWSGNKTPDLYRGLDPEESALRHQVHRMLEALDLLPHAHKSPSALSGGQRQRVAFGRALLIRPKVLLLDEPFASLDAQTRREMQELYRKLSSAEGTTSLLVTHDLREALVLGDRFARLCEGRLLHYPDRAAFAADPYSGVAEEQAFWRDALSPGKAANPAHRTNGPAHQDPDQSGPGAEPS